MTRKTVPYPEMIMQVGERIARRSKDEFIQSQTALYRNEEQETETRKSESEQIEKRLETLEMKR